MFDLHVAFGFSPVRFTQSELTAWKEIGRRCEEEEWGREVEEYAIVAFLGGIGNSGLLLQPS